MTALWSPSASASCAVAVEPTPAMAIRRVSSSSAGGAGDGPSPSAGDVARPDAVLVPRSMAGCEAIRISATDEDGAGLAAVAVLVRPGDGVVERDRLRRDVARLLRETPFEDGQHHPAEEVLLSLLQKDQRGQQWITETWQSMSNTSPNLASGLLRCLGMLPTEAVEGWGHALAEAALRHSRLLVREAAVVALERWGDERAVSLLRATAEPVAWLRDYIRRVLSPYEA